MRVLIAASVGVLAFPGLALAAEAGDGGGWLGPFAVIAAGVGMAIAAGLCGLGQGRAVAAAVEGEKKDIDDWIEELKEGPRYAEVTKIDQ